MSKLRWMLAASAFASLAACSDDGGHTDIAPTLRFADRTDLELTRLMNAALGTEMFLAEARMGEYDDGGFDTDPCPSRAAANGVATITGGCTRSDGTELRGAIAIDNPLGWDAIEYGYTDDTVYTATGWTTVTDAATEIVDGTLRRADQFSTWDADLTVTSGGVAVRSDLYYHCANPSAPHCALTNSGIELIGVGGALASGAVDIDRATNRQSGSFTLRGVDRLHIELAANCLAWSIEGTSRGRTCP